MPEFVRKNLVVCTVTFTAADGTTTQPSSANLVLNYYDQTGAQHQVSVPMTYENLLNMWTAAWDSSASGEGTVFWLAYGIGTLQAAAQGSFQVYANAANNV